MSDSKKTDPVILVCGFGRCGSSLMMQMLNAGGIPTIGDYPAFEDERTGFGRDGDWIAGQHGKALKILDPQDTDGRPSPGNYKIIWLDRNHKEQAKSQAKFSSLVMGLHVDRQHKRALAASYRTDTPIALKVLTDLGSVLRVRFEDILSKPEQTSGKIHVFLGRGDVIAMSSQVRPRLSNCADGLEMEITLCEEHERAPTSGGGK